MARSRWAVRVWRAEPAPRVCSLPVMSKVFWARSRDFWAADDAGLGLVEGVLGVADFDADLFAKLFGAELGLAGFELGAVLVGFGDAVAEGEVEVDADVVVGGGVVEGVGEGSAVCDGGGGGDLGVGVAGTAEAGAAVVADEGEGGEEGVAGGGI